MNYGLNLFFVFLVSWDVKLGCLFEVFPFLNVGIHCYKILLELVLLHPISFDALCLIFICFKILFDLLFQFLHWLFRASCFISMYLWIFQRWGLWWECVSNFPTCFDLFFCHLKCRKSLSFWISSKGNCSVCSYIFSVSMAGGKFRAAQCCNLGPESVPIFIHVKVNRCQFKLLSYSLFWFMIIGCQVMLAFVLFVCFWECSTYCFYEA